VFVRVGFGAVPEGALSASSSIATLGALGALWGALCAMVQRDLRRFFAYASIATSGMCFYGLAGLTPEGIAGAVMTLVAHGLAAMLFLGFVFAVEERVRTRDAGRVAGLAADAPALAGMAAVGLGVSLGVPGLAGAWGDLLAFLGGFARFPVLALVLAVAVVASAVAHLRVARLVLLERSDPSWRSSAALEPFGGRLPDATAPELFALVPVAAIALLLGLWPAPILSLVSESARDFSEELGTR
jgi:NADH-quinone oxidoreductase subunit M